MRGSLEQPGDAAFDGVIGDLVARTSDDFVPAYVLMAAAILSFLALLGLPERARKPLT